MQGGAIILGGALAAADHRRRSFNKPPVHLSTADRVRLAHMRESGRSWKDCGRAFKVTDETARRAYQVGRQVKASLDARAIKAIISHMVVVPPPGYAKGYAAQAAPTLSIARS